MITRHSLPALSPRDRRTILRGAAAIAFVLLLGKGLPAWWTWRDQEQIAADELAGSAAQARALLSQFSALRDSLHRRSARLRDEEPALVPGDTPGSGAAALASLVTDAAHDAGIKLAALEPRADTGDQSLGTTRARAPSSAFVRVSVHGELTGDIVTIMQFLADIEHGPTMLAVRDLSITQPEPTAPTSQMETLHGDFTVVGLARRPALVGDRKPPETVAGNGPVSSRGSLSLELPKLRPKSGS